MNAVSVGGNDAHVDVDVVDGAVLVVGDGTSIGVGGAVVGV